MTFTLSRFGANVISEVQRWQYFLRRMGAAQTGAIDGAFGLKTETGTKIFQVQSGLPATGKVNTATLEKAREFGYTIQPNDYYQRISGDSFPPVPQNLQSPSNDLRNETFTCFTFRQRPLAQRPDKEAIVVRGSCDGSVSDWPAAMIVDIEVPQLRFAKGFSGRVTCHKLAAEPIKAVFEAWERADLLHLIISYEGCYVPRYKRRQAPAGTGGHSERKSSDVGALSNHSFGSAFDVNFNDNQLGVVPAVRGSRGCVRELVKAANDSGFFWGGHFGTTKDGMHFELSQF